MTNTTKSINTKKNKENETTMKKSTLKENKEMAKTSSVTNDLINIASEYYNAVVELVTSKADEEGLPVLFEDKYIEGFDDRLLNFTDRLHEDTGFNVTYNIQTCECCGKTSVLFIFS